jgi:hypothetical protein
MDTLAEVNAGAIAVAVTLAYIDFRLPDLRLAERPPEACRLA